MKLNIFSVQLQRKKVLHFPLVQSVLNDDACASGAVDKAAAKYYQVIKRLGQENRENRFCYFDQLEPCVIYFKSFHASGHHMHC